MVKDLLKDEMGYFFRRETAPLSHAVSVFGTAQPAVAEKTPALFRSNAEIGQYNSMDRNFLQKVMPFRINELGEFAQT